MNIIVTCGCGDTDKFVKDAYKLIFPKEELPPIMSGEEAQEFYETDDYTHTLITALTKSQDKFAFLLKDGGVWDLLKGNRVA